MAGGLGGGESGKRYVRGNGELAHVPGTSKSFGATGSQQAR